MPFNTKFRGFQIFLLFPVFFWSCTPKEISEEESFNLLGDTVLVSKEWLKRNGWEIAHPSRKTFVKRILASGMVEMPPDSKAEILTPFEGRVGRITIIEGQEVKKGEILFTLENPEYLDIQRDFLIVKSRLQLAELTYERKENLAGQQFAPGKELEESRAERNQLKTTYEVLKAKLKLMSIDAEKLEADKLKSEIPVLAPIDGYVSNLHLSLGSLVNLHETALNILNTEHIHLELNVYEPDIPFVAKGQQIRFRLSTNDTAYYPGFIKLLGHEIDENSRSMSVHAHPEKGYEFLNLRAGMFVDAEILSDTLSSWALPESAFVELNGEIYVLMLLSETENEFLFVKQKERAIRSYEGWKTLEKNEKDRYLMRGTFELVSE